MRPLALLLLTLACHAGDAFWMQPDAPPVPEGAELIVEAARAEYLIGENVLLHVTVHNASDQAFDINVGGDYRGAPRALRFQVTARQADGSEAVDPCLNPFSCMGGISHSPKLEPGAKHELWVPLNAYRRIDREGIATMTVTHDFGWRVDAARPHPVGTITLRFRAPTAEEAEQVVERMVDLLAHPIDEKDVRRDWRRKEEPDFNSLWHSQYLAPLQRAAAAGCAPAVAGIAAIGSPEAVALLLRLAHPDQALALEAGEALCQRLPLADEQRAQWEQWAPGSTAGRNAAWDAQHTPAARTVATALLAADDPQRIALGARMCEMIGTAAELPPLLVALGRVLPATQEPRREGEAGFFGESDPFESLRRAALALWRRGARAEAPERVADLVRCWAVAADLTEAAASLPSLLRAGDDPVPMLRIAAQDALRPAVASATAGLLARGLADPDLGVVYAACAAAARLDARSQLPELLRIMGEHPRGHLLRRAGDVAHHLGGGVDALRLLVSRPADDAWREPLTSLLTVVVALERASGNGVQPPDDVAALRARWIAFLDQHAERLRRGERFALDDPALDPELFRSLWQFNLRDGSAWPR